MIHNFDILNFMKDPNQTMRDQKLEISKIDVDDEQISKPSKPPAVLKKNNILYKVNDDSLPLWAKDTS